MNLVASAILRGAMGPTSYAEYYGASSLRGKSRSAALEAGVAPERGNGLRANNPAQAQKGAGRQQAPSKL